MEDTTLTRLKSKNLEKGSLIIKLDKLDTDLPETNALHQTVSCLLDINEQDPLFDGVLKYNYIFERDLIAIDPRDLLSLATRVLNFSASIGSEGLDYLEDTEELDTEMLSSYIMDSLTLTVGTQLLLKQLFDSIESGELAIITSDSVRKEKTPKNAIIH